MMSDLEKTGQNVPDDSAIVIVETGPGTGSRNKLFRPTGLQEESSDATRLRSKAPAVSNLSEDVKTAVSSFPATKDPVEAIVSNVSHHRSTVMEKHSSGSSGKHKHRVSKKSSSKRRAVVAPAENIPLNEMDSDRIRKEKSGIPALPIPPDIRSITSGNLDTTKAEEKRTDDLDDQVAELRTPRPAEKIIDWSDDGEAGGLPRTESRASRASRVSRAVRQLFCCGVAYDPPSEDDLSCHRVSGI